MQNALIFLYLLLAIFYGWWAAGVVGYSAATQYWGQRMANTRAVLQALYDNEELNDTVKKANLFGFQKLITCKNQRRKTKIRFLGNFPFFFLGMVIFPWYAPILGILIVLAVKYFFLNRSHDANSSHYLQIIIHDLTNELAHQRRKRKIELKEIHEREFFIHQLELIQRDSHETEESSIYRYKEIDELREKEGAGKRLRM